jgi:hypothetical protein
MWISNDVQTSIAAAYNMYIPRAVMKNQNVATFPLRKFTIWVLIVVLGT